MNNMKFEHDELVMNKVKAELELVRLREIEIEDMKLKIEEMELEASVQAQQYDDMPKGSGTNQKDNGSNMIYISNLKLKIKKYEVANKRVENSLKVLSKEEREVIEMLLIDKKSLTKVSMDLGRQNRTLNKIKKNSIQKIARFYV